MLAIPTISDASMAFPADALDWMPPYADIPDEFKKHQRQPWVDLASHLFFNGSAGLAILPKSGADPQKAFRAVSATLRSFAPKHEHKTAAVAFMLSEWFSDYWFEGDKTTRALKDAVPTE